MFSQGSRLKGRLGREEIRSESMKAGAIILDLKAGNTLTVEGGRSRTGGTDILEWKGGFRTVKKKTPTRRNSEDRRVGELKMTVV